MFTLYILCQARGVIISTLLHFSYWQVGNNMIEEEAKQLLQAQAQLWNHIFSFIKSMSLNCAVELGIPDIIHNHGPVPITLHELAASIPIPSTKTTHLRRLMHLLVHDGIFAVDNCDDHEGFVLTPMSKLLVKDEGDNLSPFLLMILDSTLVTPWHFLGEWFMDKGITTPFSVCHGSEFWDMAKQCSAFSNKFNQAMACDGKFLMNAVVSTCASAFEGLRSMVDVGGGTGGAAQAIVEAFPHIEVTVLDLPHVVIDCPKKSRVKFVEGDMFQSIPQADAIFLKWILHDWSDEECTKILKKCREAIPCREEGGKVIILEIVVNCKKDDHQYTETQYFFDMLMMVLTPGKEREENEWKKLCEDAGFTAFKITPVLGTRSLIELYH